MRFNGNNSSPTHIIFRNHPSPENFVEYSIGIWSTLAGAEEVKEPRQKEEDQAPALVMADYLIQLHTSNCRGAGVPGRVSVDLKGEGGSTGMQQLKPNHDEAFGRGQVRFDSVT